MSKRILVIDDESAVRKSFLLALEDTDYQVETAASGQEGVEKFKQNRAGLIFCDLKMPVQDGVETLRQLRAIDRDVPFYVITAFVKEYFEPLNAVVKEGLNFEVLNKPIGSGRILAIANSIFENPVICE